MKSKFLSKILISFIAIAILLAPISPILKKENGQLALETKINKAEAIFQSTDIFTGSGLTQKGIAPTEATLTVNINTVKGLDWKNTAMFKCNIDTSTKEDTCQWYALNEQGVIYIVFFKNGQQAFTSDLTPQIEPFFSRSWDPSIFLNWDWLKGSPVNLFNQKLINVTSFTGDRATGGGLTPATEYTAQLYFESNDEGANLPDAQQLTFSNGVVSAKKYYPFGNPLTFKTLNPGEQPQGNLAVGQDVVRKQLDLACSFIAPTNLKGCLAEFTYAVWEVGAYIMELSGKFLDFFIYYGLNSSAYTSVFVVKGWTIIRDIANIFFIITLLYIAIKTILSLNVTNNKKLISAVVIIALLINFSLFVTQIVIDSSNILARVFYNEITTLKKDQSQADTGAGGEKSISVNLVSGFDPQNIITNDQDLQDFGTGMFIFITVIMIFLSLYCAYMFFVVAILLIGRVVALWLAMIFSPLAFISYALPAGFDIPFGYKKWWKDLLESAFMAPIFIFFLYIIILFIQFGKEAAKIAYANTSDPSAQAIMLRIMGTIIPFAIIFLLLTRAKKLAVDYSGELGKALTKVGGTVLGVAGGAVMGGAALVGTGVIGGVSSRVAGSEKLKIASEKKGLGGWAARMALKTGDFGQKATFDVRKTAAGGALGKAIGADFQSAKYLGLGSKAGGFQGITERRAEAVQKESELVKTRLTDKQVEKKYEGQKDKNGNEIRTAQDLNNLRMQTFVDNIGKTSLLSSVAYSTAKVSDKIGGGIAEKQATEKYEEEKRNVIAGTKYDTAVQTENRARGMKMTDKDRKEFKENLFEKENNKQEFVATEKEKILDANAKTIKMVVGGVGGVGLGAITGGTGIVGGMGLFTGSLAGAGIGAAAGGIGVLQEHIKESESERLARLNLGRSLKGLTGVANRLNELTTLLKDQQGTLTIGKNKFGELFGPGDKIDKDKLSKRIAMNGIKNDTFKEQMKILRETIRKQGGEDKLGENHPDVKELRKEEGKYASHIVESKTLESLEDIEEKINDTEQKMFIARGGNPQTGTPAKATAPTNFQPSTPIVNSTPTSTKT